MLKKRKIIVGILTVAVLQLINYIFLKNYGNKVIINTNASWSLNLPSWLFICLLLISFVFIIYIARLCNPRWPYSLVILLSAAISNLLDRLIYGGVMDYIDTQIWPVFNVADILIVCTAVLFGWQFLTKKTVAQRKIAK